MKVALVLSGGGMFGAWQAGAWRALSEQLCPDLVVGASVGALNGCAIAGGATSEELTDFWLHPDMVRLDGLPDTSKMLLKKFPPRIDYAVVLTDMLRLKPKIFQGGEIIWQHLAASCGIPLLLPQYRLGGRWYGDGGLLNPLPIWAAIEMGATKVIALHALPVIPSAILKPFVRGFRLLAGHNPPAPASVEILICQPESGQLGSMRDALRWNRPNAERWLAEGYEDARRWTEKNISFMNCFEP